MVGRILFLHRGAFIELNKNFFFNAGKHAVQTLEHGERKYDILILVAFPAFHETRRYSK